MLDVLAWVSIILSAVSITLAVVAIIFGWVTFRNANRMQTESSALLSQVSQKVEVVSARTSRQLDKAWDYVTQHQAEKKEESSEQVKREIRLMRKQVIDEARKEASIVIENAGLDRRIAQSVIDELKDIVDRVTKKSIEVNNIQLFLEQYNGIEEEVKSFAVSLGLRFTKGINLLELLGMCSENLPRSLSPRLLDDVKKLMEARNKVVHGRIDFSEKELTEYTRSAAYIHGYLRPIVAEIRYFQSIFAGTKFSDVDLWPKKPKSDSK